MNTLAGAVAARQKKILYRKYVKGKYATFNKQRIDYVIKNVYKKQLQVFNSNEQKVINRLQDRGLEPQTQKIIPIIQAGGKINHLYIADIVVGNTIIEVDGPQHNKNKKWDDTRDKYTLQEGYNTIRIPTSDLSEETIDNYLNELYTV